MLGSQAARPRTRDVARRNRAGGTPGEALLGLEHEFVVRDRDGPVDFRGLIHRLGVPGRRVDPYDRNAYRCAWGGTITTDDGEAEVAIAPVDQVGGFTGVVDARARIARAALEAVLPPDLRLEGYSTHLSVSTPVRRADAAARLVARAFAPSLILMADRAHSPGLLVMPRPGRTELAVEYVDGAGLRAATALAVGSVLAAISAVGRGKGRGRPLLDVPEVEVDVRSAIRRFGWYVDRAAFGEDLLTGGRSSLLHRNEGGTITAGEHLEAAWAVAREALDGIAAPADLVDADRMVAGTSPLPIEDPAWSDGQDTAPEGASDVADTPFGALVRPHLRPGFAIEAVVVTWDFAVFALVASDGRQTRYASVPRMDLRAFVDRLDRGELDAEIARLLAEPGRGRLLTGWRQAHVFGYHDAVAPLAAFAPPERDPRGQPWTFDLSASPRVPSATIAAAGPAGAASVASAVGSESAEPKLGKVPLGPPVEVVPQPPAARRIPWLPIAIVLGVIIALLVVGTGLGLFGGRTVPSPSAPVVASPPLTVASPSTAVATCTGPSIELVEHFFVDVAHTGGATPPVFSTPPGARFCLIELDTYHWNEGAGAPAGGTLSLIDGSGATLGSWKAVASAGQGGVLSGWTASVPTATPVILDGSYTVEDSDPATLSWSEASGGAGFLRVWAQLYAPPGTAYSLPPSAAPSVPEQPTSIVSISGMMQSDSPAMDSCTSSSGTKYQSPHYMYSFVVILASAGQPTPPLSAYGNLIGRTATLTLVGSHDAGTYKAKVAVYSGFVQIRFDGRKCPNNAPRSTISGLTIDGLTLRPGPGTGYLADPPSAAP